MRVTVAELDGFHQLDDADVHRAIAVIDGMLAGNAFDVTELLGGADPVAVLSCALSALASLWKSMEIEGSADELLLVRIALSDAMLKSFHITKSLDEAGLL